MIRMDDRRIVADADETVRRGADRRRHTGWSVAAFRIKPNAGGRPNRSGGFPIHY
jgi:hypothetical protein